MTDPTRRIQQLIALATDPAASEEEARTAALQAARGIRQHNLQVTSAEAAWAAQQGGYYTEKRPCHSSEPTPRLPPRPSSSRAMAVPGDETGYGMSPMRGGAHILDWDFKDDQPGEKPDQAFSPALLALLRK